MNFSGPRRYFIGGEITDGSVGGGILDKTYLDEIASFRHSGILKVQTANKLIYVNATIYNEIKQLIESSYREPTVVLSNGLLAIQDDLSRISIAWERTFTSHNMKEFFAARNSEVSTDIRTVVENVHNGLLSMEKAQEELITLGCHPSIVKICITGLLSTMSTGDIHHATGDAVAKILQDQPDNQ